MKNGNFLRSPQRQTFVLDNAHRRPNDFEKNFDDAILDRIASPEGLLSKGSSVVPILHFLESMELKVEVSYGIWAIYQGN